MDNYSVKVKAHFDAAHFLAGYAGKCKNIHGHRWVIEVNVVGDIIKNGEKRGMVVDFGDLKLLLGRLVDDFDHTLIYEKNSLSEGLRSELERQAFALKEVDFRPTAECFAAYFYSQLSVAFSEPQYQVSQNGAHISSVTVYETPENSATYSPAE
jgi:6-pyruvoyltetrahydropterin/6-carboxytetrahydropterin synthase